MKKLATLGFMVVLLAACNGSQRPSASVSPNPSSAASSGRVTSGARTETPSPPSATPSPEPPAVGLHVQCRLPVYWQDSETSPVMHVGFVRFPSGQLVADKSANPGSYNAWLFYDFYDRAYAKWIHSLRDWVSPDGRQYAYADGDPLSGTNVSGNLHVVDVASGADRAIYNSPVVPTVVAFTADGIYFTHDLGEGAETGLWLIAPEGGQPTLISSTIFEPLVANGAAWGRAKNPADPHPVLGGINGGYDTIVRFDLNTGASKTWWYQPGEDIELLDGDYSGNLFASTSTFEDGSVSDWWLDSRGAAHRVGSTDLDRLGAVDSNGVWFADRSGGPPSSLWLFSNGRLERIAGFNVATMGVAGGCIPGA